ncbi:uncharacterized protein LOC106179620 [Lingula anatina]|uniref:Uncharacterized protein LOC106179620 n=1 Tax=Lingula anatina TaxID=7574 RepID=A0A1S3K827_LINAN|nr:uncharacterized protein LOC106179620 [Lingula anatina]|eukprot:XP_013418790.1 uncharacterized protein LOC106179620 [Lingula anatina]
MNSSDPHWIKCHADLQIGDGYNFDTMEKTQAIIEGIEEDSLDFTKDRDIKIRQFTGHLTERDTQTSSSEGFVRLKAKAFDLTIPGVNMGLKAEAGASASWKGSGENTTKGDVTTLRLSIRMQTGIKRLNDRRRGSVRRKPGVHPTHYVSSLAYGGYLTIDITARVNSRNAKENFERDMGANAEFKFKEYGADVSANSKLNNIEDYLRNTQECTVNVDSSVSEMQYDVRETKSSDLSNLQKLINRFVEKVEEQNGGKGKPMLAKIAPLSELDNSAEPYEFENRLGNQIKDLEDRYDDICSALGFLRTFFQDHQTQVQDLPHDIIKLEKDLESLRDTFTDNIQGLTHRKADHAKNKEIVRHLEAAYTEFSPTAVGLRRCIGRVRQMTQKYIKVTDTYEQLPEAYAEGKHTNIVAVGKMGTGKSSTCNMMVEKEGVFRAAFSSDAVTKDLSSHCANVGGRDLRLIDTPGLLEAVSTKARLDILQKLANCISLLEGEDGIDVFLFVIRCDEMPSQEELGAVIQLGTLFSEVIFEYMVVVATHKDHLDNKGESTKCFISNLPDKMKTILQKAGGRMMFINNVTKNGRERRDYIKDIIGHVDDIAKAHKGEKFSHKAISVASEKRRLLREKYPQLSDVAIQSHLEKDVEAYLTSQYWCFGGSSTVRLSNGSVTPMAKLSPGDKVLCVRDDGSVGFEEIFCFGHADSNCQTIYVHLETSTGQHLLLSYGHYIHASSNSTSFPFSLKAARDIRVGDGVFVYHPATNAIFMDEIVATGSKKVTGAFCPHTLSGTIIVNDILASCYTDSVQPLVAEKLLMPAWFLYEMLPLLVSAPVLKYGVSYACKFLSATKQYFSRVFYSSACENHY